LSCIQIFENVTVFTENQKSKQTESESAFTNIKIALPEYISVISERALHKMLFNKIRNKFAQNDVEAWKKFIQQKEPTFWCCCGSII
jgi:hypothetical protein